MYVTLRRERERQKIFRIYIFVKKKPKQRTCCLSNDTPNGFSFPNRFLPLVFYANDFSLFFSFDFFWLLPIKYTNGWWAMGLGFGTLILSIFLFCHLDLDLPLDLLLTKKPLLLPLSLFRLIEIEWFWFYGCCYIIYESHDNASSSGINIKRKWKTSNRHTLFNKFIKGIFRLQWKN